ncbi:hypothetical protein NPIL_239051 [Nephila pilipes]|uniref:Uncharacterized protein n=1 Tax=Nephila pilipes TaxID=299642 RepID=A0A8X6R193_NEPPI|nr:hypothetical protein NPIL_239051 [Nephila pilipes]
MLFAKCGLFIHVVRDTDTVKNFSIVTKIEAVELCVVELEPCLVRNYAKDIELRGYQLCVYLCGYGPEEIYSHGYFMPPVCSIFSEEFVMCQLMWAGSLQNTDL